MVSSKSPDFEQECSFQLIKNDDDKFFSRLVSKESSKTNPSFRIYHENVSSSAAAAVPFIWESTPGTPKHDHTFSHHDSLPPLTPPPSYQSNVVVNTNKCIKKHSRSKTFSNLFMKMNNQTKHSQMVLLPSSSSSSSVVSTFSSWSSISSSSSSSLSVLSDHPKRRRFSRWGSSAFDDHDHELEGDGSRTPGLCFGIRSGGGLSSVVVVKKALLSIVGRA